MRIGLDSPGRLQGLGDDTARPIPLVNDNRELGELSPCSITERGAPGNSPIVILVRGTNDVENQEPRTELGVMVPDSRFLVRPSYAGSRPMRKRQIWPPAAMHSVSSME